MPERSDPTSNAEIARNALAPEGFGRRRAASCVGAPNDGMVISGAGH